MRQLASEAWIFFVHPVKKRFFLYECVNKGVRGGRRGQGRRARAL